jgi:23S rRNA pseudouridine2457 synthase
LANLILFNKPFRVLSQFTDTEGRATLADFLSAPGYKVAGRLDYDSEGLLILTNDGKLQQQIANPRHKQWKTYQVQVEGTISDDALAKLAAGVLLKDGQTLPAQCARTPEPAGLWPREPPVRSRKTVTDSWLELSIREGRNRQVRRMTAAVDYPTLRLVRQSVAHWALGELQPGEYCSVVFQGERASPGKRSRRP